MYSECAHDIYDLNVIYLSYLTKQCQKFDSHYGDIGVEQFGS